MEAVGSNYLFFVWVSRNVQVHCTLLVHIRTQTRDNAGGYRILTSNTPFDWCPDIFGSQYPYNLYLRLMFLMLTNVQTLLNSYLDLIGFYEQFYSNQLIYCKVASSRPHRGAICQFLFRWIWYCHSGKSTGKKTGKLHLCGPVYCSWLYSMYINWLE